MRINLKFLDLYITVLIFFKKIYYIVKSVSFQFNKSKKYLEKKIEDQDIKIEDQEQKKKYLEKKIIEIVTNQELFFTKIIDTLKRDI